MSKYYQKKLSLLDHDLNACSDQELAAMVSARLAEGIHGVCFSPYIEGQGPGTQVPEAQISERLDMIADSVDWIRSFSCREGHEYTPSLAKQKGLNSMVGVWIDDDLEANEEELQKGIELACAGDVSILAVGNEVLLREELSVEQLVTYLERARQAVPDHVQVGYVDAYYLFELNPDVVEACDVVLANCYPFWEGCPLEFALLYMKDMYHRAQKSANGRPVIIAETGWPSAGTSEYGAIPSPRNAMLYFLQTCRWADEDGVKIFYFSAFDEVWKVAKEGDVGAYWGLWDSQGDEKYV